MPELPTLADLGLPGFEATSWFALYAPAGIPKDVLAKINAETAKVILVGKATLADGQVVNVQEGK